RAWRGGKIFQEYFMRLRNLIVTASFIAGLVLLSATAPQRAFTSPFQTAGIKIKEQNPVVNEGNTITLTAVDSNGQPVTGVTWESGSPEIAGVDSASGMVRGVLQGYATVTARRGSDSVSTFVTVSRVSSRKGVKVMGDQKVDTSGAIYFSDPQNNVIFKRDTISSDAVVFAGKMGVQGRADGQRQQAQFAGPPAVSIDNRPQGGIYIADTLNHSIRKIAFSDQTATVVGKGSPGMNTADVTPFAQAAFNGPFGVAVDVGG